MKQSIIYDILTKRFMAGKEGEMMDENNSIWKDLDIDSLQNKNERHAMIPFFVHEGEMARMERVNRRLWILCLVIFLALVVTNAGWIYYESQLEDVVTTQEVDQDIDTGAGIGSGDIYVHGIGDIYGKSEAEGENNNENP